ncbi:MAG: glycerophosphodiester phosphodiesterase [Clostridium sp.]|nr:glycerophosphodiester phosphodiesterase [Clostridium sp.]
MWTTKVMIGYIVIIGAAALAVLYLLAIMPRLGNRKKRRDFLKVYYAHRGLHDNASQAPENSMAAFQKAVDAGYGIEMDVQMSSDGVPVVFHDFTLERICGREGKVCDYTWRELKTFRLCGSRETIPKFEEALDRIGGRVPLIVELKVERLDLSVCSAADALLAKYPGLYCIESFNPLVLRWYKKNRGGVVRGQLSDGFLKSGEFEGLLYFLLQNLLMNWLTKPDFVAYNHRYEGILSRKICRSFYRNMAAAWTIKSQGELDRVKDKFDIFIFDSFIPDEKRTGDSHGIGN